MLTRHSPSAKHHLVHRDATRPTAATVRVGAAPARFHESVCHPPVTMKLDSSAAPEPPRNFIGRNVSRLRYQRGWTQDELVAKLQIHGCDITRDIVASVEILRSTATDKQVWYLAVVFDVDLKELYHPLGKSSQKSKVVGIATPVANRRRSDSPSRTTEP